MNQDMLAMVDSISREKMMDKEMVFTAIEESMAFAAKKRLGEDALVQAHIDRRTGDAHLTRVWNIREDNIIDIPDQEMARIDLEPEHATLKTIEEPLSVEFGRSSAQLAKQSILQRLRDMEQTAALEEIYQQGDRVLYGSVRGFQKGAAMIDIGRLDAQMPKTEQLMSDKLKIGQRIRCSILKVERLGHRNVVTVSRTCPEFLEALLEREVPEIEEGLIEIVRVARAPGIRSKVIVRLTEAGEDSQLADSREGMAHGRSQSRGMDAARTVIGSRGIHAKALSEELGGEHIDVLNDVEDPVQALKQALEPAQMVKVFMDEEANSMDVAVEASSLGLAIGSRGSNIRLISDAIGWTVNLMSEDDFDAKNQERDRRAIDVLMRELEVDEEVAQILVESGLREVEEVAYAPIEELDAIEDFDAETVAELRSRAVEAAEKRLSRQTILGAAGRASLTRVESITEREVELLLQAEIFSADDLADLATDELLEVVELPQKRAQELIMNARKLWEEAEATQTA